MPSGSVLESQASETAVCVIEVVRRFGGAVGAVEPVVGGGGGGGVVAVGGGGGGVAGCAGAGRYAEGGRLRPDRARCVYPGDGIVVRGAHVQPVSFQVLVKPPWMPGPSPIFVPSRKIR